MISNISVITSVTQLIFSNIFKYFQVFSHLPWPVRTLLASSSITVSTSFPQSTFLSASPVKILEIFSQILEIFSHRIYYSYAIKNQRKARNAPSRGIWVPWAGSLWHKRAGVATLWFLHYWPKWQIWYG